jgi:carbon starvation protein
MLLEGIVAVVSLATVAMLAKGDTLTTKTPLAIYGAGMGRFLSVVGVPEKLGSSFGLLALSTFILTTLDTATRLNRYIFEEFFGLKGPRTRYLSTAATLILPTIFVLITFKGPDGSPVPVWKAIWPIFGATNQLLAGLAMLAVAVWLKKSGKKILFILGPMVFMNVMTIWALILLLKQYRLSAIGLIAGILLLLALTLLTEAYKAVKKTIFV